MYHLIIRDKFEVKLTMSFRGHHKLSVGELLFFFFYVLPCKKVPSVQNVLNS